MATFDTRGRRHLPSEPVDTTWDDEGVLPEHLGPDTQYLFDRMTRATLGAVDARDGDRILDLGCGRGHDLASLRDRSQQLFGCDGSLIMAHKARQTFLQEGLIPRLVCASAENLPFRHGSFRTIYCKGALDHFYDPRRALQEAVRVLTAGGRLVISVANFGSLGCRLGKLYNRIHKALRGRELPKPHFWEIPDDHVVKFDRRVLHQMLPQGLTLRGERGISLLWGVPHWGEGLRVLPRPFSRGILRGLDHLAGVLPSLADVLVVEAVKPPPGGTSASADSTGTSSHTTRHSIGEGRMKNYSRLQGFLLCLGTVIAAVLFLIGVISKSYWALAIPVAIGFLWLLGLGFWIGWTLLTIRVDPNQE